MSQHFRYQVYLGSRLIGEVFVLNPKHIEVKKVRRGLKCKRVSA